MLFQELLNDIGLCNTFARLCGLLGGTQFQSIRNVPTQPKQFLHRRFRLEGFYGGSRGVFNDGPLWSRA